jgi:signal transduction histidine kinase
MGPLVLLLLVLCGTAPIEGATPKRVLVLAEGPVLPPGAVLRSTIVTALRGDGTEPLSVYEELIDRTHIDDAEYDRQFVALSRIKYADAAPDLIITITEPALDFVLRHRRELFPDAALLSGAVDERAMRSRNLGPNATGVFTRIDARATLEAALALHPHTRRVVVVGGRSDKGYMDTVREELRPLASRIDIAYVTDKALRDVVAEVAALRDGDLVLLLSMQTDGEGVARTGPEIVAALRRVATVPIYSMSRVFLGRGIVGGVLGDMERHGLDLTARARQILRGDRAADLPAMVSANQMAFDWGELKRFGIDEARLPAGATVVNRQLGLWETYRRTVLVVGAVLLGQGVLIGMLWLQSRRLQESEHRYRVTAERNQGLAGRLISAQEEERTRIARELHDDISQQLAILQMDLHQLAGLVQGPAETIASEATQSAENIATSVRNLSHELYPASLRLIGLVSALKGLVAELSERRLRITFTHDAVPAKLPPDLSLCVFRIVQEALQNALKHSHANSVSVDLRCEDERLAVTVTDDGVGFVVEGLGQQGFGLIGMGERVEAMGGRFTLWSSPHRGTILHATLPMLPIDRSIASAV